jgi:hypothetical protein
MRNGATSMRKSPAHDFVQTRSALAVIASDSACHAGGRGFESRRSRLGTANKKRFLLGATPLRDAKGAYRWARTVAAAHSRLLVREGRPHAGVLVVARPGSSNGNFEAVDYPSAPSRPRPSSAYSISKSLTERPRRWASAASRSASSVGRTTVRRTQSSLSQTSSGVSDKLSPLGRNPPCRLLERDVAAQDAVAQEA